MTMISTVIISLFLSTVMLILTKMLSLLSETSEQKWSTFECGFITQTPSMPSFSMQFFLIMILFLIFDIEVSLLFPFSMSNFNSTMKITMTIFLLILLIGLLAEWKYKKLNWSN